jgi:hypothetical protein
LTVFEFNPAIGLQYQEIKKIENHSTEKKIPIQKNKKKDSAKLRWAPHLLAHGLVKIKPSVLKKKFLNVFFD